MNNLFAFIAGMVIMFYFFANGTVRFKMPDGRTCNYSDINLIK